jgi:pilus assembly protein Flp/PilA
MKSSPGHADTSITRRSRRQSSWKYNERLKRIPEENLVDLFVLKTWIQAKFNTDSERGASMVEYGLLLALVAVIAIVALKALGTNVSAKFSTVSASLN